MKSLKIHSLEGLLKNLREYIARRFYPHILKQGLYLVVFSVCLQLSSLVPQFYIRVYIEFENLQRLRSWNCFGVVYNRGMVNSSLNWLLSMLKRHTYFTIFRWNNADLLRLFLRRKTLCICNLAAFVAFYSSCLESLWPSSCLIEWVVFHEYIWCFWVSFKR